MNLAKPPRRGPKPKKPIARTSRPSRVRKSAAGRAKLAADLAWAKAVRESGPCAALGYEYHNLLDPRGRPLPVAHHMCFSATTAAHIVSRRYAATRTEKRNGLPLCLRMHQWFTSHPLAWEAFVTQKIGAEAFAALKAKAQAGPKGNS